MPGFFTQPFSKSKAYHTWLRSILIMFAPVIIATLAIDFTAFHEPAIVKFALFFGGWIYLLKETEIMTAAFDNLGFVASEIFGGFFGITLISTWIIILALPAFDRFSQKWSKPLHLIQLLYSSVHAFTACYLSRTDLWL